MQGGYTKLMLEQLINSQDDSQADKNAQVKFIMQVYKNYNAHIWKLHPYK